MNAIALAPRSAASEYGSRAQVACERGDVWAGATYAGCDALRGAAMFAVRVANNSDRPVRARLVCEARPHRALGDLAVAAFSILEATVPIPLPWLESHHRATIVVEGRGIAFSICVPSPARARAGAHWASNIAIALLVLLAVVAAVAAHAIAPSHALARRPAPIGAVTASRPVARPLARPHAIAQTAPLLDDLVVSPLPARAGGSLEVTYSTSARGEVWLLDLHGSVWGRAPLDPSGRTWLHVPQAAAGREMRVVAHAFRGARHAEMGAGIVVLPDGDDVAPAASDGARDATAVTVEPQRVGSGAPIHVALRGAHGEALVTLTDASGSVVQEVDAPAGGSSVLTLVAPGVAATGVYDVVVSLTRGVGQEEIVRPVTVAP